MQISIATPAEVSEIINKFERRGFQIYIVGGLVRDVLLTRQIYDWDLTTDATPEQILEILPESFYDNKFGTVGVKTDGRPYEITTFRTETTYSNFRHPDAVAWGKSLEEDLKRRDFTINAMALKRVSGKGRVVKYELIDMYGGLEDLKLKLIRAVGKPEERFAEDALRMMRAVRIAAQLGFSIEEETFKAIKTHAQNIKQISAERVRDELLKIMASDFPADGYLILRNTGLGIILLPEMESTFGVKQQSPGRHHIYDVGTHSVEALRHCPSPDPITRLATLIHDVGKVQTQRVYADGKITFYNHEMESERIAKNIAARLRFSNEQKDKFIGLVRWHQFSVDERQTDSAVRRFIKNTGGENIPDMLALRTGDRLGGGARETSWRLEEFKRRLVEVQKQPFRVQDLKISGVDVMGIKNIPSGPLVGKYLETLFDEVVEKGLENERDVLIERLKQLTL
jgi:tRNA nucleotidyltransferase/poly(A) polymerase